MNPMVSIKHGIQITSTDRFKENYSCENNPHQKEHNTATSMFEKIESTFPTEQREPKPLADIPLNPGWLIGTLIMAYEIIPI